MLVVHDHQYVINTSPHLKESTPESPLVAYGHPPNLKDVLVRGVYDQVKETHTGNTRCWQPRCKICTHRKMGTTIHSMTTGIMFKVKASVDFCTNKVVFCHWVQKVCRLARWRNRELTLRKFNRPQIGHSPSMNGQTLGQTFLSVVSLHSWRNNHGCREDPQKWCQLKTMEGELLDLHILCTLTPEGLNINS